MNIARLCEVCSEPTDSVWHERCWRCNDYAQLREWIPESMPDDTFRGVNAPTVYGCREPRELRFRRQLARWRARAIRNDPIVLHPDHYAWLERELRGENE